ncbi:MAG: HTH-type transcriptional regulator GalS [Elusimicrobia bacterium]|nr:HTH-type transcriptional regulator GalS [Elusimicrobiota bacterium]
MTRPTSSSKTRVRMRDVAARCGVSISTVSLVLSGDPRIPEDTARAVIQAVKSMEYRPSVLARSLARRTSRTIAVVLPEFAFQRNKPFYYQALQGIHSQTQAAGYKMLVEAANKVFLARRYYLRMLREQSADGLLYLAATINDKFLSDLETEPYPFVLVGASADGVDLPCCKSMDLDGAKMAVQHLIKLGHKSIGHITGSEDISHGRDRRNGYFQQMKDSGFQVKPEWVVQGNFDLAMAEKGALELVKAGVTAIFAANDVMATAALRALRTVGKRVPEDIAVVGMDDLEFSDWSNPRLTTVRYDIRLMAELATKYVIRRAQSPMVSSQLLNDMPAPELIIRESCGAQK